MSTYRYLDYHKLRLVVFCVLLYTIVIYQRISKIKNVLNEIFSRIVYACHNDLFEIWIPDLKRLNVCTKIWFVQALCSFLVSFTGHLTGKMYFLDITLKSLGLWTSENEICQFPFFSVRNVQCTDSIIKFEYCINDNLSTTLHNVKFQL